MPRRSINAPVRRLNPFCVNRAQACPDATWAPTRSGSKESPERQMMTRMLFALSLGFAALIPATQGLRAQTTPPCAERPKVIDVLAQKYGETRRGIGLAANNTVMELYVSPDTGTWTIAVTQPDGITCLMASGQGYEPVAEDLPAKGDPA